MKTGTVARIVSLCVFVAVLAMILVPVYSAFQETGSDGVGLGIPSVYDLDEMNADSLETNVKNAMEPGMSYEIAYGNERVAVTEDNVAGICAKAILSGASSATLYGQDGGVASQPFILYTNGNYMTQKTAIMAPGMDSVPMDLSLSVGMKDADGNVMFRGNSTTSSDAKGLYISFQVPTVPYIVAAAAGYDIFMMAQGGIDGIFSINADIAMNEERIGCKEVDVAGVKTLVFDSSLAGNCVGSIGDGIVLTSSALTGLTVTSAGDVSISERINDMASDGPVPITMDGKTYMMEPDDARGLASMFETLEASA